VENTRYAHVFHSRQWSNYNLNYFSHDAVVARYTALCLCVGHSSVFCWHAERIQLFLCHKAFPLAYPTLYYCLYSTREKSNLRS